MKNIGVSGFVGFPSRDEFGVGGDVGTVVLGCLRLGEQWPQGPFVFRCWWRWFWEGLSVTRLNFLELCLRASAS